MTDALSPQPTASPAPLPATAGDVLTAELSGQAAAFLRTLPPVLAGPEDQADGLLTALRRLDGALYAFEPLVEADWAGQLRAELGWLRELLLREPSCARQLARLLGALDSLAGTAASGRPPGDPRPDATGMLAGHPGAAKARALLDRQLSTARSRAHTSALGELRSARLHALADRMALLTGEVPLTAAAGAPAGEALLPYADRALRSLAEAARSLPLPRAGTPYNGDTRHRLPAATADAAAVPDADAALDADDAPWVLVRVLAGRARCVLEVCGPLLGGWAAGTAARLAALDQVLDRHQEAAAAAGAAASAARTPRITPATAYVLGVLHTDQRLEVEAARYAFGRRWSELAGRVR
ncbi:CHAD domain-containing protein [Streptomyces sp. NPDC092296]|uniref:CHAD domain-containing protein n=1 Tax=Streptomyces sp. NPDC092296 TaxID=3366012 RepID=UPI0038234A7E